MKKSVYVGLLLGIMLVMGSTAVARAGGDYEAARKYYYSGKYKEAVRQLQDYVAQKPDAAACYMMGYSLYKLKRFDQANEYFREAYLIDPSYSPVSTPRAAGQPKKKKAARQQPVAPEAAAPDKK